jgi:hypothetical protein
LRIGEGRRIWEENWKIVSAVCMQEKVVFDESKEKMWCFSSHPVIKRR